MKTATAFVAGFAFSTTPASRLLEPKAGRLVMRMAGAAAARSAVITANKIARHGQSVFMVGADEPDANLSVPLGTASSAIDFYGQRGRESNRGGCGRRRWPRPFFPEELALHGAANPPLCAGTQRLKTLHKYITGQVLASLLLTVAVCAFVVVLLNVVHDVLPLLFGGVVPLGLVAKAIGLLLPFACVYALPMGFIAATLLNVVHDVLPLLFGGVVPLGLVAKAIGLLLPFACVYALPMGFISATLLVFGRFSADQELTAMRASGVSLLSLVTPVLLLSLLCCGLSAWFKMDLAPPARAEFLNLRFELLHDLASAQIPEGQMINEFPGYI